MVVCGDFNIHVDQTQDVHAGRLSRLLQSFDCRQHVTDPTHTGGHTLDLVITRTDTFIRNLCVGDAVSDHAMISFKLDGAPEPTVSVQLVQPRAWRRLSLDSFTADLQTSTLCRDLAALSVMSIDELADTYNRVLTELLDQHCPLVTVRQGFSQ